jgi:hypothetical protein
LLVISLRRRVLGLLSEEDPLVSVLGVTIEMQRGRKLV